MCFLFGSCGAAVLVGMNQDQKKAETRAKARTPFNPERHQHWGELLDQAKALGVFTEFETHERVPNIVYAWVGSKFLYRDG